MCNPNSLLVRVDTHSLHRRHGSQAEAPKCQEAAKVMAKVLLMKHAKRRDNGVPADRLEIINCDCPTRETVTCQKHDLFNCELVPHVPRGKPVAGSGSQPFHTELVTREILE